MSKIKIGSSQNYFIKDGKPFFLLSDTDWMAFQKLSVDEFEDLVIYRRRQGFTALQISVLPVTHDNASSVHDLHPFEMIDGKYQFDRINMQYFDKARQMLAVMQKHNMVPFLHLFWCNYIPDTWAAERSPNTVIPFEFIRPLAKFFIEQFDCFDPIYSATGDTRFETEQVVKYYIEILDVLHALAPDSLTTMHLTPFADPPQVLCEHPQYHFYAYQSGHAKGAPECEQDQNNMILFSQQFLQKSIKKPIVNTEPCYEGHGFAGLYGRFNAYDIRRAAWLSLLSGAAAGVTYGAHGVWQFFRKGDVFGSIEFSSQPFEWRTAMGFQGAWDGCFSKWLFEQYNMFGITPCSDINARGRTLLMAEKEDMLVLYLPYQNDFEILRDLSEYKIEMVTLESKRVFVPEFNVENGKTSFFMAQCNEDAVIIARR